MGKHKLNIDTSQSSLDYNNSTLNTQHSTLSQILDIQNLSTGYDKKQVLFGVSLQVQKGETVLLVGSNGSGKSTLLKTIFGIIPLWHGAVSFQGNTLHSYPKLKTPHSKLIMKKMMYLPQKDELFEDMNVQENLEISILHLRDAQKQKQLLAQLFEDMSVLKDKRQQLASQLSGGERKMVSLGMALLNKPNLLLFDEPFAGLSEDNIDMVIRWLETIKQNGTTLVIIEHRIKKLLNFADRVVGLKLGRLYTDNLQTINDIKQFLV